MRPKRSRFFLKYVAKDGSRYSGEGNRELFLRLVNPAAEYLDVHPEQDAKAESGDPEGKVPIVV